MKSKQTLKVGQKYRVIKDYCNYGNKTPRIVTVTKLGMEDCFFDEKDNFYVLNDKSFKLQLITPKKSQWKYTKSDRDSMLEWWNKFNGEERTIKLIEIYKNSLVESTPKKKSKEIKEIEVPKKVIEGINKDSKDWTDKRDFEMLEEFVIWIKQVTDTINLLIKNK